MSKEPAMVTAETITDDDLERFRQTPGLPLHLIRTIDIALGWGPSTQTGRRARDKVATAYNARHSKETP